MWQACDRKQKSMLEELSQYEQNALLPLQDCQEIIKEGLIKKKNNLEKKTLRITVKTC